jgi:hypothetical protein
MAPPITVDIMAILLGRKNIPRHKRQQGKRRSSRASLPRFPCRVQAGTLWSVAGTGASRAGRNGGRMVDVPVTIAWKNRVLENRREIEALREQGLVDRKVEVEEIIHPSTRDIAKIMRTVGVTPGPANRRIMFAELCLIEHVLVSAVQ